MPAWCWPDLVFGLVAGGVTAWAAWFFGYTVGWWDGWLKRGDRLGERSLRLGHDFETFGSVNQDSTPGNLLPNQFLDLRNGRFRPNGIGERGGKRKFNPDSQLNGCPTGIFPAESTPRRHLARLFITGSFDPQQIIGGGLSIFSDGLKSLSGVVSAPAGLTACAGVTYVPGAGAGGAGGTIYLGGGFINADVGPSRAIGVTLDFDDVITQIGDYNPDPGNDAGFIGPAVPFNGDLYFISSQDTNGVTLRSRVYSDPLGTPALERNANTAFSGFYPMWLLVDPISQLLVAPLEPGVIHYRDTAGTWATTPMPVSGTVSRNSVASGCVYNGSVFFTGRDVGGAYAIYSFSGGGISLLHSVAGSAGTFGPMCSHAGVLYFAYKTGSSVRIGKMNPSGTFTDGIHTFTGTDEVLGLASHSGKLWALRGDTLWSAEFPDGEWTLEASGNSRFANAITHPIAAGPLETTVPQDNYVTTNLPEVYRNVPGERVFTAMSIPSGVDSYSGARCDSIEFDFRRIFVGPFSRGLISTPGKQLVTLGITAPTVAPTLATAGGGSQLGDQIGFYSWVHKEDGVDIHESDLSPGSATITFSGTQQRDWTIPGTGAEARVTHVRLYVSIDGALPVFVKDLVYGTTSDTEDVTAFGPTPPVDGDGNLLNARGVPPYSTFVTKWKLRAVYGPDPDLPYRFWLSEPNEPESVGPLNYIDLTDKESLTLLKKVGDDLCCTGAHVLYALTGYDETDFFFHKVSDAIGCINYFGAVVISEILWFPDQLGIWNYVPGGTLRYMMDKTVSSRWERDYKANPAVFENAIAVNDREEMVYMLMLPYGGTPRDRRYVGSYEDIDPAWGGQGPMRWTFDECDRPSSTLGILLDGTSLRYEVYSGSCDGWVRKENVMDDADDDGDTGQKRLLIQRPHFMPKKGKDTILKGGKLQALTSFVVSELVAWMLEIRAGGEQAYLAENPTKRYPVRRSAKVRVGRQLVPLVEHTFHPQVVGKGWVFTYLFTAPLGVTYGGEWYRYGEGSSGRAHQ